MLDRPMSLKVWSALFYAKAKASQTHGRTPARRNPADPEWLLKPPFIGLSTAGD
jgi:hypothetical protein